MATLDQLPVALNGKRYLIDWTGFRRQTVEATRQLVDQGAEASDTTFSNNGLFKRTCEDFSHGSEQKWYDPVEDSDRRRWRTGWGIDPWTRRSFKTHNLAAFAHDTSAVLSSSAQFLLPRSDGLVYIYNDIAGITGAQIKLETTPAITPWTVSDIAHVPLNNAGTATTDGFRVWFSDLVDTYYFDIGDVTTTTFGGPSFGCGLIAWVNGHLIAANSAVGTAAVWEFTAAGAKVGGSDIWQHPAQYFNWQCIAGAPQGVYLAGCVNSASGTQQGEVYVMNIDETTGAFATPVVAAILPDGEAVNAMASYAGIMVLGTTRGLRIAQIDGNGFLNYGPLVEIPGGISALECQGEFVWFSWETDDRSGLGRADLSRFVGDLVPAVAPDLMVEGISVQATSIVTYNNVRYFTMHGRGVYRQDATKWATSAELHSGRISFGTPEQKRFLKVEVRVETLPTDVTVTVYISVDGAARVSCGTITTEGVSVFDVPTAPNGLEGEYAEISIVYSDGDGDASEQFEGVRWSLYAVPLPDRVDEIYLPIVLHEEVDSGRGLGTVGQSIYTRWSELRDLVLSRDVVDLTIGSETISCYADGLYIAGQDDATKILDWNYDHSWMNATWIIKLVTVE